MRCLSGKCFISVRNGPGRKSGADAYEKITVLYYKVADALTKERRPAKKEWVIRGNQVMSGHGSKHGNVEPLGKFQKQIFRSREAYAFSCKDHRALFCLKQFNRLFYRFLYRHRTIDINNYFTRVKYGKLIRIDHRSLNIKRYIDPRRAGSTGGC